MYPQDDYMDDPIYQYNEKRSMCRHTIKSKEEVMIEDKGTRANFESAAAMVQRIKMEQARKRNDKGGESMADEMLRLYPTKINGNREPKRCGKCNEVAHHKSSQDNVTTYTCCRCHVEDGNPPSDWHEGCMKAYNELKSKEKEEE